MIWNLQTGSRVQFKRSLPRKENLKSVVDDFLIRKFVRTRATGNGTTGSGRFGFIIFLSNGQTRVLQHGTLGINHELQQVNSCVLKLRSCMRKESMTWPAFSDSCFRGFLSAPLIARLCFRCPLLGLTYIGIGSPALHNLFTLCY